MTHDPFELVKSGDWDAVLAAIEADAAVGDARDENGVGLLLTSLYHRRSDVTAAIESRRAAFDPFEAAALGRSEDLERHLDEGFAIDSTAPDGFTALHLAAFFDRGPVAELLLERGADPSPMAKNPSRVRPIHSAVAGRSGEIIDLLIARNVDLDAEQMGGWTALHAACKNELAAIARALVEGGADPLRQADDGSTARTLMPAGADPGAYGLGADAGN